MKISFFIVALALGSFSAFAQQSTEVRMASRLEGGIDYIGVRQSVVERTSNAGVFKLELGAEVGAVLGKANLGPSVGLTLLPSSPIRVKGDLTRDLIHGETISTVGLEAGISDVNVSLNKSHFNPRGSQDRKNVYSLGVRVPTSKIGGRRY